MKAKKLPVLNDPIYGFIGIESGIIFELLSHPFFQRLRRISQMGLSYLVYPGARHSRFEHALGAMHLMNKAVMVLRKKGVDISNDEREALSIAILLHDIGHGPFSHALEECILIDTHHEALSLGYMELLNEQFDGKLSLAIQIFNGQYPRKFMGQLVASQLDIDRLDYLKRDSFYTGATEGNINTQRIIEMFNVVEDELVVEEKGLFSVEKFIMARRLMYWQVYLHKTGLAAELLLSHLMQYVRSLVTKGQSVDITEPLKSFFLSQGPSVINKDLLERFSRLDDIDILASLKVWQYHQDEILSGYANRILNRRLMKMRIQDQPFTKEQIEKRKNKLIRQGLSKAYADHFVFSGSISSRPYSLDTPSIKIVLKSGEVKPLEEISSLFKRDAFTTFESKSYLCYPKAE
ncbi:MAG: HD domain-containing protein [Flavobacteriaceae bacterium]